MRILLANKFYYRRGGDCVYVINLEQLLKKHGHQVAVFAMDFPENLPSDYSKYFPSEVKFKPGLGMFETLIRPFGSSETKKKFKKLLDDFKPDIVHLNNIHTQLSPILAEIAHARGVKVVWTLHDYKLLCPRYDCLKNGEAICEECFENKHKVLDHKCMKNSGVASLLAYKEAVAWHRERLEKCTDAFICPSEFMASKMAQGGFNKNRLIHLCNFIDVEKCKRDDDFAKDDYYCFIGRLSHEKGARTLIEAANQLPERKLVVIGGGPLESELRQIAGSHENFWRMQGLEGMGKRWGRKQESRSLEQGLGTLAETPGQWRQAGLGRHGQKPIIQEIQFQRLIWALDQSSQPPHGPCLL